MKPFAVKSNSWNLMKAFKKDAEKLGRKYDHEFSAFKKRLFENTIRTSIYILVILMGHSH